MDDGDETVEALVVLDIVSTFEHGGAERLLRSLRARTASRLRSRTRGHGESRCST